VQLVFPPPVLTEPTEEELQQSFPIPEPDELDENPLAGVDDGNVLYQ